MKNGVEDFVVESTPVLDLKKSGLGQPAPATDANWDSDRTEVYTDSDSASSIAYLVGEGGEHYPITTFPFVMGRGSECDLVLQGKGVSRRHAEIIFQSGRFVVNDLESLNGLKINGYKVARVILEENDTIRLGDVSLVFQSGVNSGNTAKHDKGSPKSKRSLFDSKPKEPSIDDSTFGTSSLKRTLINVAAMMVLIIGGWFGFQFWQGMKTPRGISGEVARQDTPQQSAPSSDDASRTVPAPKQAVPREEAAPTMTAQQAATAEDIADPALAPPPSIAPPPSLAVVPKPKPKVSSPPKAQAAAKSAPVARTGVEQSRSSSSDAPRAAVRNNTDKARASIGVAEKEYMQGNADRALNTLKTYMSDESVSAAVKSDIQNLYRNLTSLQTLFTTGQAAYDRGDKETAFNDWMAFMQKESAVLSGRKSTYSRNISSRVMNEYVSLGNEAARSGDNHRAYRMWQKSLELGDNVAARIAIDNANNRAMQLYRQALRLEYVNTSKAKALWREVVDLLPPGTEYNTKAGAKLAWYEKWGT